MPEYSDTYLKDILNRTKSVAVVGVSMNPVRPSYYVARYLSLKGYKVFPVNPGHAGKELFGQKVSASLSELNEKIDMVDIFRRSEAVPPIVEEALDVVGRHRDGLELRWRRGDVRPAVRRCLMGRRGPDRSPREPRLGGARRRRVPPP